LGGRKGDKLRRAFLNSQLVCFAFDDARLIGTARALTDWEYHALIYDVAVHPDFQRSGIGTRLIENLLERLPVWRVMLVAADDVQAFYARLGFSRHPEALARFDWSRLYAATSVE
jgi:ribosomal protein S18 acetylase RimI-like enzyme